MLHESDLLTKHFLHMKQKIGDVEIVFGSDKKKAIHYIFPKATHLLCTKHLKDKVRQNLRDNIECSRQEIDEKSIDSIF